MQYELFKYFDNVRKFKEDISRLIYNQKSTYIILITIKMINFGCFMRHITLNTNTIKKVHNRDDNKYNEITSKLTDFFL